MREQITEGLTTKLSPSIAIVLVNYNGWRDTIECLDSIFRLEYSNYSVFVCDNNSSDGSIQHILDWAKGDLPFNIPQASPLRDCFAEPLPKPIQTSVINWKDHEDGHSLTEKGRLFLINVGQNLGFAGANNVGIKFGLELGQVDYFWLLNNDTIVKPDSLTQLIDRSALDQKIGICGSRLLYYDTPLEVQTLGGSSYNPIFGVATYIKPHHDSIGFPDEQSYIESKMDMVSGASMFVSASLIRDIGLLSEEYFLFNEEIDWAIRAKGKYRLGYAPRSTIYHKKGRSIGSTTDPRERSENADYYNIRSRLIFTKRYYPQYLVTVYLSLLGVIFNRLRRGQFNRAKMIIGLIINSLRS